MRLFPIAQAFPPFPPTATTQPSASVPAQRLHTIAHLRCAASVKCQASWLPDPSLLLPVRAVTLIRRAECYQKVPLGQQISCKSLLICYVCFQREKGDSFVPGLAPGSCYSRFGMSQDTEMGRLGADSADYLLIAGGTERTWNSLVATSYFLNNCFRPFFLFLF